MRASWDQSHQIVGLILLDAPFCATLELAANTLADGHAELAQRLARSGGVPPCSPGTGLSWLLKRRTREGTLERVVSAAVAAVADLSRVKTQWLPEGPGHRDPR